MQDVGVIDIRERQHSLILHADGSTEEKCRAYSTAGPSQDQSDSQGGSSVGSMCALRGTGSDEMPWLQLIGASLLLPDEPPH